MSRLPLSRLLLLAWMCAVLIAPSALGREGEPTPASPKSTAPDGKKPADRKPKFFDPPPAKEQLQAWLAELDSDEFVVRETATENLIASGPAALEPLKKSLAGALSLEATTRCLHILQQLALIADFDTQEAARTLLEEVADRRDTSTGRRAATVLVSLNEKRSSHALAELEELGANVSRTQVADGFGGIQEIVDAIEIGEEWRGESKDLRRLKWLQPINRLILVGDKIGDEALPHVAKMQLTSLHAYQAKLSDQGLAAIAEMEKLQELGIYYIPLSDAALKPLEKCKSLITLRLYGTNTTRPAVETLQAGLGLTKVDYRNGAFLGVGCDTVNGQCIIANVHPNSPADKGGIRDQDTLLTFDGKKIADFQELTACISDYKAGQTVNVELQRIVFDEDNDAAQKKLTVQVTLGEWDKSIFIRGRLAP
jgi:hypothetical protein